MLANGWTEADILEAFRTLNITLSTRAAPRINYPTSGKLWAPFFAVCWAIVIVINIALLKFAVVWYIDYVVWGGVIIILFSVAFWVSYFKFGWWQGSKTTRKMLILLITVGTIYSLVLCFVPYYLANKLVDKYDAYHKQAMEFYDKGQYDRAIEYFQKMADAFPDSKLQALPYLKIAFVYYKQKDYQNASLYCQKAVMADPEIQTEKGYSFCTKLNTR